MDMRAIYGGLVILSYLTLVLFMPMFVVVNSLYFWSLIVKKSYNITIETMTLYIKGFEVLFYITFLLHSNLVDSTFAKGWLGVFTLSPSVQV